MFYYNYVPNIAWDKVILKNKDSWFICSSNITGLAVFYIICTTPLGIKFSSWLG